jgi:hypothetical protein
MDYLIANGTGVLIAEIITLPICTVKTIYQTQNPNLSIKQTINTIYGTRGITGFYNATYSALAAQTISSVSKYTFYNLIKNHRKTNDKDLFNNAINGASGGILGSLLSHPIDVRKNYQQRYDNNFINDCRKNLLKTLYKGYSQSIVKNVLLYSALYPIYDFYKCNLNQVYMASALTSITICMYLQPIDYIKTNMMAGNKNIQIKNLYKGTTLHLARSIPHFMISMIITEEILDLLPK